MEPSAPTLLSKEPGLRFTWRVDYPTEIARATLIDSANQAGLFEHRWLQLASGDSARADARSLGDLVFAYETDALLQVVVRPRPAALIYSRVGKGTTDFHLAGRSPGALDELERRVLAAFRPVEDPPNQVPVTFWASDASGGVSSAHRRIEAPAWTDLAMNHADSTAQSLQHLMGADGPSGGRLILWHGVPGTGKTHALKALAREWREWCIPHFVTDPEVFLGDSSSYLMQVLTRSDPEHGKDRPWRLVILEDSGELLAADARERTGQALSRLLNVTDGLIGQGMSALVLVTTNEPVRKLHPAVTRPGRCWSEIEFERLSTDEANRWLRHKGSSARVNSPHSVADLYATLAGKSPAVEAGFGFAAA